MKGNSAKSGILAADEGKMEDMVNAKMFGHAKPLKVCLPDSCGLSHCVHFKCLSHTWAIN